MRVWALVISVIVVLLVVSLFNPSGKSTDAPPPAKSDSRQTAEGGLRANVTPANEKFTAHFAEFLEDDYQVVRVFVLPPQDGGAGLYVSGVVKGPSGLAIGVWFFSGSLRNPLGMAGSLDQTAERVSVLLRWQRASEYDREARIVREAAEAATE